ncbi:MAG TPA: hypothetical protein VGE35_01450 [Candidatus Paceibacterota bacterium]
MHKRILIIGDSGRGKSTFAGKLAQRTGLPLYSTDDFYWKTKFSEPNDKAQSISDISKVYDQESWIMEGGTRHLIEKGIPLADKIYSLRFKYMLPQYYFLITRKFSRKHETFANLWGLLKHVTKARYVKSYRNHKPSQLQMISPYPEKVTHLYSLKEIKRELESYPLTTQN